MTKIQCMGGVSVKYWLTKQFQHQSNLEVIVYNVPAHDVSICKICRSKTGLVSHNIIRTHKSVTFNLESYNYKVWKYLLSLCLILI